MNSRKKHWIRWQINFDVFFHKFTFSAEQVTSRRTFSARWGGGGVRSHPTQPPCLRACVLKYIFHFSSLCRNSSKGFRKENHTTYCSLLRRGYWGFLGKARESNEYIGGLGKKKVSARGSLGRGKETLFPLPMIPRVPSFLSLFLSPFLSLSKPRAHKQVLSILTI